MLAAEKGSCFGLERPWKLAPGPGAYELPGPCSLSDRLPSGFHKLGLPGLRNRRADGGFDFFNLLPVPAAWSPSGRFSILLCPAWKKHGSARTVRPGTVILHSRADDVVPFADSEELVRNSGLPASALVEVGDDHYIDRGPNSRGVVEQVVALAEHCTAVPLLVYPKCIDNFLPRRGWLPGGRREAASPADEGRE
jgi:hypothetical protein